MTRSSWCCPRGLNTFLSYLYSCNRFNRKREFEMILYLLLFLTITNSVLIGLYHDNQWNTFFAQIDPKNGNVTSKFKPPIPFYANMDYKTALVSQGCWYLVSVALEQNSTIYAFDCNTFSMVGQWNFDFIIRYFVYDNSLRKGYGYNLQNQELVSFDLTLDQPTPNVQNILSVGRNCFFSSARDNEAYIADYEGIYVFSCDDDRYNMQTAYVIDLSEQKVINTYPGNQLEYCQFTNKTEIYGFISPTSSAFVFDYNVDPIRYQNIADDGRCGLGNQCGIISSAIDSQYPSKIFISEAYWTTSTTRSGYFSFFDVSEGKFSDVTEYHGYYISDLFYVDL